MNILPTSINILPSTVVYVCPVFQVCTGHHWGFNSQSAGETAFPSPRVPYALLPDLLATAPLPSGFPFTLFPGAWPILGLGSLLLLPASSLSRGPSSFLPPLSALLFRGLAWVLPLSWGCAWWFWQRVGAKCYLELPVKRISFLFLILNLFIYYWRIIALLCWFLPNTNNNQS